MCVHTESYFPMGRWDGGDTETKDGEKHRKKEPKSPVPQQNPATWCYRWGIKKDYAHAD